MGRKEKKIEKKIKMSDSKKLSVSKSYDPSEITTVGMIETSTYNRDLRVVVISVHAKTRNIL